MEAFLRTEYCGCTPSRRSCHSLAELEDMEDTFEGKEDADKPSSRVDTPFVALLGPFVLEKTNRCCSIRISAA